MSENYRGLSGQTVALVTAGASGIGRTIAAALAAQGCRIHVCDIAEDALARFRSDFPGATATLADVSKPSEVERLFAELQRATGRLDVLVNNAGIAGPTAPVESIGIAEWDQTIAVDLSGHFYVTRLAVPMLKAAGGGSIVNISSNAGLYGCPLRSPYVAAKWALIGLTKTWAMELGPQRIRVNALCPGSVKGPRIDRVIDAAAQELGVSPAEVRQSYLDQSSLGLFVDAEDIAQMVLYLCSDLGASISGQALGIDGHTESLSTKS